MMMNSLSEQKDATFKSYIDEPADALEDISLEDYQKTLLLEGETLIHEAHKVLLFTPLSDRKKAAIGVLTVTTFKLSFATAQCVDDLNDFYQYNNLLRRNEICLSCIDTVYQVGDKSKKKLPPGQSVSAKIKELQIVCKNMRVLSFSFKHADKDSGRTIANALLHHAFPKRKELLFAYDFRDPCGIKISKEARFYLIPEDWKRELDRGKCTNWRISDVNNQFDVSMHLPRYVVVPKSITDAKIITAARHFRNQCFPVWVWGTEKAALVRMADLLPGLHSERTQETILIGAVQRSHPDTKPPVIFDLSKDCPQAKDVQNSYLKLRNLCIPDSSRLFKVQDFKFYGLLDSSKWLHYVSTCLTTAMRAAKELCEDTTVVLQEDKGQDMNCIVSSLIQIILDPHWRTRKGFQSLIQKEWIAIAHPFASRLGHVLNTDIEPAYIFLLFLDCVWQLLQQYPVAFQFSETYLTTVWDSAHVTMFDTFLFNCEHDRYKAFTAQKPLAPRSLWDWNKQFPENDIVLFNNPLYDKTSRVRLDPVTTISSLDIWRQCYFRWLPDLEIRNGGKAQIDLCNRFLADEVHMLRTKQQNGDVNITNSRTKEDNLLFLKKVNSFYPFSHSSESASASSQVNDLLSDDALDTQSILNLTND